VLSELVEVVAAHLPQTRVITQLEAAAVVVVMLKRSFSQYH
jgi:hypothetical protein